MQTKPTVYKTTKEVPYVLAELQVPKQESKVVTVNFTIQNLPATFSLYKQSGYDTEKVRVIITRAADSRISEELLRQQGFEQVGEKWVKTFIRKEDISVRFSE
jgi:hypothetical protein